MLLFFMNFEKAEIFLKAADHLAYVTYPLTKDKNLLKKIFENLEASIENILNFSEMKEETIKKEFSRMLDEKEINKLLEMAEILKRKKNSTIEFLRKNQLVWMNENLKSSAISLEELKEYIRLTKKILIKLKTDKYIK